MEAAAERAKAETIVAKTRTKTNSKVVAEAKDLPRNRPEESTRPPNGKRKLKRLNASSEQAAQP